MKLGCCLNISDYKYDLRECLCRLADMGYSYFEPSISTIAQLSDTDFDKLCTDIAASPIGCEAVNGLFPAEVRLTGTKVDKAQITSHLNTTFERANALGAKIVVFGSGGAKNLEEGCTYDEAAKQYADVLQILEQYGAKYDGTITVEHLNKLEANFITSIKEMFGFLEGKNYKHVKMLIDYYHMKMENEDESIIAQLRGELCHLHIADEEGRTFPLEQSKDKYADFFKKVKAIGYNSRLSIEARTTNFFTDAAASAKLLLPLISQT